MSKNEKKLNVNNFGRKHEYLQIPSCKVEIEDSFWSPWQEKIKKITIYETYNRLKETGRIDAFRMNWKPNAKNIKKPHRFWDSDVAKWIETASYIIENLKIKDKKLLSLLNEVVDLVCSAQQPDGYLNVYYTLVEPDQRWKNLKDGHELYCAGHLLEAAIAHYKAINDRKFLNTMIKYIDYIGNIFGNEENKLKGYPGHEEIELSLIKLYRLTKNKKYLDLCKYFIEERGQWPHYFMQEELNRGVKIDQNLFKIMDRYAHYQAHLPVREHREAVGHCVRAGYLYSAVADIAYELNDMELFKVVENLWTDITQKKIYITGGIGSVREGESFGPPYFLPNEEAYCESCAAISLMLWSQRMLNYTLESKYADIIETILYNGFLSGISLDGKRFFYENPLAVSKERKGFKRELWYSCACCPNNITRIIANLGSFIYIISKGNSDDNQTSLYINQFISSSILIGITSVDSCNNPQNQIEDANGEIGEIKHIIQFKLKTNYPWDGNVKIKIRKLSREEVRDEFAMNRIEKLKSIDCLKIRIPDWLNSDEVQYSLNISETGIKNEDSMRIAVNRSNNNYLVVPLKLITNRLFESKSEGSDFGGNSEDLIEFELDIAFKMDIKLMRANPKVKEDRGKIAIKRGPIVYCLEEVDNGQDLDLIWISENNPLEFKYNVDLLGGIGVIETEGFKEESYEDKYSSDLLYSSMKRNFKKIKIKAIPYFAWCNREPGEMRVWISEML
ncbi:MAG: glycoside hydrolase family 127 protein [Promethearchaeota archaeon]